VSCSVILRSGRVKRSGELLVLTLGEKAGKLSFNLRRKGIVAGLSDCYIAVAAQSANAPLLTLDKHFSAIR